MQQSSTAIGPSPRDPLCEPKHFQRGCDSGRTRVVLSQASGRNPCQRRRLVPQAFCSLATSWPCNQESESRGKTQTRLAKRGHGNRPSYIELSGSQSKNFMKAGAGSVQRDGQHQPKSPHSPQLAVAAPLLARTPFTVKGLYDVGVQPFCKQIQIGLYHGYPSSESNRQKVAGALWRRRMPRRAFFAKALERASLSVSRPKRFWSSCTSSSTCRGFRSSASTWTERSTKD